VLNAEEELVRLFDRAVWRLVDAAIFVAVVGMVLLICTQVGTRFLGHSAPWTEELSRFLFIWTTFLGMATGFRYGTHPSLGLFAEGLPWSVRKYLCLLTPLAALVFFSIVAWFAFKLFRQQLRFGEISPILQIGMWITTLPLIISAVLAPLGAITHALGPLVDPDQAAETRR